MTNPHIEANSVNDSNRLPGRVALGRGGAKASLVVSKRKPGKKEEKQKQSAKGKNKCREKAHVRIGTWNIRTMRKTGKLANVIAEMRRAKLDVLGLAETRWKEDGDFASDGIRIIHTAGTEGQSGVAIMLEKEVAKAVTRVERHGSRIIEVTIKAEPMDMVIIQVYMPTASHPEEEIDEMYEKLEEILERIKGTEYTVIMGDWNAVVGEGEEGICIGKYGLGKRNNSGEKLAEFCERKKMMITNTWFQHEKRRRYTWKAPGDTARYQLDYILVQSRYRNSVKNSRSMPGADADTDHNLVVMNIQAKLKFMKRKKKNRKRWNKKNLKEKSKELGERIEENLKENEGSSIEERWKGLKEAIIKSANDIIGIEESAPARKPWITEEMIMEMEERRKWKHQSTEEAKKEYRRLNNKLRRTTEEAREKWWEEQCREIEELQQKGMDSMVYNKVKNLSRKNGIGGIEIRDKQGKMLSEIGEVKNRWKEYIEELYKDENANGTEEEGRMEIEEQIGEAKEDIGPELLEEEVRTAIKELKNDKTEGYDDIPAEMLKSLDEKAMKEIIKICQEIYTSGIWPEDYLHSIMVPIKKKPNATRCEDHRTISLITHASKILIRILTKRLQAKTDAIHEIGDDQFGFRKGMGTRDAIGSLRVITERSCEIGKDVYICFVDYEKAFDRVDWKRLMKALRRVGVDWRDRRLIGNLYMGQKVQIRIEGEYSEQGKVGRG